MLEVVVTHERETLRFPWPSAEVRLGSSEACDWVLPFPGVSRKHAAARPVDGILLMRDLGSRNGLVSDGCRHLEVALREGQSVRLGHAVLSVEPVESSDVALAFTVSGEGEKPPRAPGRERAQETGSLARGTQALALALVRELGRDTEPGTARRPAFWRTARQALGAAMLWRCRRVSGDDIAITDLAGAPPTPELLAALAEALDGRTSRLTTPLGPAVLSPPRPGTRSFVVAAFPPDTEVEPWEEMFLAYLAEHLRDDLPAREETIEPRVEPGDPLRFPGEMVVGGSPAFQALLDQLRSTSPSRSNVLLYGETGTGKELVARLIHLSGPIPTGPFVAVNCAAIPAELFESEFFGIEAGVATGVRAREGLLQQAHGGTLLLDEVGSMPLVQQAKLLRVLQEREVAQLGARRLHRVDARIIAASNQDLEPLVASGQFRADLFYRLSGLAVRVPALRERPEDVPDLVLALVRRAARRYSKPIAGVSHRALARLMEHPWPGNIRELGHVVDRAVLLAAVGGAVRAEHLALRGGTTSSSASTSNGAPANRTPEAPPAASAPDASTIADWRDDAERRAVRAALTAANGQRTGAANLLGITRQGLLKKLKRLGLA